MNTKTIIFAGLSLLFAACSNESEQPIVVENPVEDSVTLVPIKVHVNEFKTTMTDFDEARVLTRGVDPKDYDNLKAITLAFYDEDNKEVYKKTQVKNDGSVISFNDFTADLPIGHYTLLALGYFYSSSDEFVLTSLTEAAFTSDKPRETFALTQDVTVISGNPLQLELTLKRLTPKLTIRSTDVRSASVKRMRTTYAKGGKRFNPTTGYALDDNGFTQTQSANTDDANLLKIASYPFLASESDNIDITIEALDANDQVLFTKHIPAVPLKRNAETTISGPIFTTGSSTIGITLDTDWLPGYEVTF